MRVLLTGANGQLGLCLQDRFPSEWTIKAMSRNELDITDKAQLILAIEAFRPDVIINAAAYTAVDKAEQEPDQADQINHIAPSSLAEIAENNQIQLIHISTDYVFDGTKKTPYTETDIPNPINIYGKTKLLGEQAITKLNPSAIIIRTSWVFSEYGNNFVKTMLRLAKERDELKIVNDQIGCPTYAGDLAKAIIKIIKEKQLLGGIYHYCGQESVSWFEFAQKIIETAYQQGKISSKPNIMGIPTTEYPTPAKRPMYSVMDCKKISKEKIELFLLINFLNKLGFC